MSKIRLIITLTLIISGTILIGMKETEHSLSIAGPKKLTSGLTVVSASGNFPLHFVPNEGQVSSEVVFYSRIPEYNLWLTEQGVVFDFLYFKEKNEKIALSKRAVIKMSFPGANPNLKILPEGKSNYWINYIKGNDPSKWKTRIPAYRAVKYRNIYRGIDLKIYGSGRRIEYDWIVNPGANPSEILIKYEGIRTKLDSEGNIEVILPSGKLIHKRPIAYQEVDGKKRYVKAAFYKKGENQYSFKLGPYDRTKKLIIDPLVLTYSTYLGGSSYDWGKGITTDSTGRAYIVGYTMSSDFPLSSYPYQNTYAGSTDAFISVLSSDGTTLEYSTYIGGSGDDRGFAIALDKSGRIFITGYTSSTDFPLSNPVQTSNNGGKDVFVSVLSADGTTLEFSSYLGGSGDEEAYGIAVNSSGLAVIAGYTASTDFPTKNALYSSNQGYEDAFVAAISTSSGLSFSTYLGGTSYDRAYGVAIDTSDGIYITGYAGPGFPTTSGAVQETLAGQVDAFLTRLSSEGNSIVYSTYLGGSNFDYGRGIAVDSGGNAYITGFTGSTDYPVQNAFQSSYAGGTNDGFVSKISSDGTSILYSTYLGGSDEERLYTIGVDNDGCAYVGGSTSSSDFPTANPYQDTLNGRDAVLTKLSPDGSSLEYSTYFGGSGTNEEIFGISVDATGAAFLTGNTDSSDFPTTPGVFQSSSNGAYEAFIAKLEFLNDSAPVVNITNPSNGEIVSGVVHVTAHATDDNSVTQIEFYLDGTLQHTHICPGTSSCDAFWDWDTTSYPETQYEILAVAYDNKNQTDGDTVNVTVDNGIGTDTWSTFLGGTGRDIGKSVVVKGNYLVVAGRSFSYSYGDSDVMVYKLNTSDGSVIWQKHFGGAEEDAAMSVVLDGSDNIYLAGRTRTNSYGERDILVYALDSSGNELWHKNYGGADDEASRAIDYLPGIDALYVAGFSKTGTASGRFDFTIYRINASNGNYSWNKLYGGDQPDKAHGIAVEQNTGDLIAVGFTKSFTYGEKDIAVYHIDETDGSVVWQKHFGGAANDVAHWVTLDSAGYIYFVGDSQSNGFGGWDIVVYKLDWNGNKIWDARFGSTLNERAYGATIDNEGNLLVIGYTEDSAFGGEDIILIKINPSDGTKIWSMLYGGDHNERGYSVAVDINNYYYIAGKSRSSGTHGLMDFFVAKVKSDGTLAPVGPLRSAPASLMWEVNR